MATCKACLHNEVCVGCVEATLYKGVITLRGKGLSTNETINIERLCPNFKDRSKYVVRENGEWTADGLCSVCGCDIPVMEDNFCPNCGADMRKEN